MQNEYNIVRAVRKLNHINRCSRFPLVRPTTVAEHSYHVTVLALFIAEDVAADWLPELKFEKVLRRALLHDAEEALMSDIPHDVKKYLGDTSDALRGMVEKEFKGAPHWFTSALLEPCDHSVEHHIAKLADHLELAMYCVDEHNVGNRNLRAMLRKSLDLAILHNNVARSTVAATMIEECELCLLNL